MKQDRRVRIILGVIGLLLIVTGLWGSVAGTNWPIAFLGATALIFSAVPAGGKDEGQ